MPLVKVNLLKGRSDEEKESIAASIQTALVSTLKVPDADRYQVFNEYDSESFRHTSGHLGMTYTDQLLIIEITFLDGRDDAVTQSSRDKSLADGCGSAAATPVLVVTDFRCSERTGPSDEESRRSSRTPK